MIAGIRACLATRDAADHTLVIAAMAVTVVILAADAIHGIYVDRQSRKRVWAAIERETIR